MLFPVQIACVQSIEWHDLLTEAGLQSYARISPSDAEALKIPKNED